MAHLTHCIWGPIMRDAMLEDFDQSKTSRLETALPKNAKDGAESGHVKFLQLFDVLLVQNPGLTCI